MQRTPSSPLTAKGKECKLCKAKGPGEKCHLHGGSPKKLSPEKSSARRSPPRKRERSSPQSSNFDYFNNLPLPALKEVLLNINNKKALKEICSNSKQAQKICRTKDFQEKYEARYSLIIFDEVFDLIKRTGDRTKVVEYKRGDVYVTFTYSPMETIIVLKFADRFIYKSNVQGGELHIKIYKGSPRPYIGFIDRLKNMTLQEFIEKIGGDQEWLRGIVLRQEQVNGRQKEFYELEFKKANEIYKNVMKNVH